MKHGLEPVLFPERDFHVLFRLSLAGQDPRPLVGELLRRALREGLLSREAVVGRLPSPLGYLAVLEDSRLHAFVFVQLGEKTYATHYTMFPSRSRLLRWYQLAAEMGDTRLLGREFTDEELARIFSHDPQGIRWCPECEGVNPLLLTRCLWCRQPLLPARHLLPWSAPAAP